jgi:hypothetical protein
MDTSTRRAASEANASECTCVDGSSRRRRCACWEIHALLPAPGQQLQPSKGPCLVQACGQPAGGQELLRRRAVRLQAGQLSDVAAVEPSAACPQACIRIRQGAQTCAVTLARASGFVVRRRCPASALLPAVLPPGEKYALPRNPLLTTHHDHARLSSACCCMQGCTVGEACGLLTNCAEVKGNPIGSMEGGNVQGIHKPGTWWPAALVPGLWVPCTLPPSCCQSGCPTLLRSRSRASNSA